MQASVSGVFLLLCPILTEHAGPTPQDSSVHLSDSDGESADRAGRVSLPGRIPSLPLRLELAQAPIPWPETDAPLIHVLTREVQSKVIDAVPDGKRGIYIAMADCLIRPSESRVLRVRDWCGDELQVVKAAKDRLVGGVVRGLKRRGGDKLLPVSPRLQEWLEAHVSNERKLGDPDGPLFQNPEAEFDGWWSETALRRVWYFACDRVSVPRIGVYAGTKHSTATALKAAGADDRVFATLMGHSDVRSVAKYAHVQTNVIRSTLAKLEPGPKKGIQ